MTEETDFEIEDTKEYLTPTPAWIVRWGITLTFFILSLILSLTFFIKYPDILSTSITISTNNHHVANEKQEWLAKLSLSVRNLGKLKTGQTVNIRLAHYPFREYGMLIGVVKSISAMPDGNCVVKISLPHQLVTTYNKKLDYKEEMQETADIITEELSVFERVYNQFGKILKR